MTTVGIVVFPGVEELDFVGPWEVFRAAQLDAPDDDTVLLAATAEPVRCAQGMVVVPETAYADVDALDVVVVPGGRGAATQMHDPELTAFLQRVAPACTWVASVCTGAFVLHGTGLARGRRMTTHWASIQELRSLHDGEVVDDRRWVVDGPVATAAGVSAGIDLALWLVGQLYGEPHAQLVQRYMEYQPEPPFSG